ncbi:chemotaxis protein CheW [Kaarinaea lacus]
MLFAQFYLDEYRYVISTANVVEIVPGIRLTPIPKVPPYIAGLCNYRGFSVPVIDLCELFLNRPCNKNLSSRIIFLDSKRPGIKNNLVGLMVEKATEIQNIDEGSFVDSGIHNEDMPFIGPVVADNHGLVTRVLAEEIIDQVDNELLFSGA